MLVISNHPKKELTVAGHNSPYLIGAVAGATAGAIAFDLYARLDPLSFGFAAQVASAYIWNAEIMPLTGAAVGAIAGVIRTAVDRRWGVQTETIANLAIDTTTGFIAAPIVTLGKCIVFPIASDFCKELPLITRTLTCSAIGGATAIVLGPVAIAASTAARLTNQYFTK